MGRAVGVDGHWLRTSACLSPEPGARLTGQVFSVHSWLPPLLCPPHAVGGHRADCGLVSMATADESATGGGRDCGGQELEGGGRARRWAALPVALWKRLPVPPRSQSVWVIGSRVGFGSALGRPAHSTCVSWTRTVCWAVGMQPALPRAILLSERLHTLGVR